MSDQNFVHLHVHTEYSLLDGLSRIDKLVEYAKSLDMPALAITDHGAMFGVIDFYRACKAAGIKPVIGMEAYLARRSMTDRDPQLDRRPYHLLLLAKNQTGYLNLLKIASAAQLEGYYYRPRIDKDFLAAHAEGIVATSGCLAAEIPSLIEEGREQEAMETIGWYEDVFGKGNFFLELQQHDIPELVTLNKWLIEYNRSHHTNVGLLATNDVHYVRESDYDYHDTLLCIQTNALKSDRDRMRMTDNSYYLTTQQEMWQYFREVPQALHNTLLVAEMCDVNLDDKNYHLPVFPVPAGYDAAGYLRYLAEKGLVWRYGARANDPVYVERLNYELSVIHTMGFDTYFLIVWDLCQYAIAADIWWNVRGSGAGSLVAYCLGITNIDPIQNNLLFERFLNPGRVSMPDIDIDYPDDRRAEMVAYTARKYGEEKVAAIITFGTMGAKAGVKDVARALAVDVSKANKITGMIPQEAKQKPLAEYVEGNPELLDWYNNDPEVRQVIDTAGVLQGVNRHASTHAAGVIVGDRPLVEYLPLHRITGKDPTGGALKAVTQFPMETCESIGLLKVDFLGLSTLTIFRKASDLIYQYHGIRYTMDNVPYRHDDPAVENDKKLLKMLDKTFEMLGRGESIGVFQLESGGMRQMLRGMRPQKFEHVVAGISLYRPGPMEFIPQFNRRLHNEEQTVYLHPALEPILSETYAIIVYQEQIMQIAGSLFGYELGEADLMRKAVSKKKEKDLLKHKAIFMERGPQHGVDVETAEKIFAEIEFFANYGFNRAHAADYGKLTVQSAFLKCHYPVEYMTALLSVHRDTSDKVATFLAECRRLDIPIMPPDVNYSELDFAIQQEPRTGKRGVRFGLAAVKNAGVGPLQHIIEKRAEGGPFKDLLDFCRRVDLRIVQKRALESLIKVGALKDFGTRPQLLAALERMISYSASYHKDQEVGQMNMFGGAAADADTAADMLTNLPNLEDVPERVMLAWEKDLLGFYVAEHPLDAAIRQVGGIDDAAYTTVAEIKGERSAASDASEDEEMGQVEHLSTVVQDETVNMLALVDNIRKLTTKNGELMAVVQLEDRHGTIEGVMFPRAWSKYGAEVVQGSIVLVTGKVDLRRSDPQIIVDRISTNIKDIRPADEAYYRRRGQNGAEAAPDWAVAQNGSSQEPPERTYTDDDAPAWESTAPRAVANAELYDEETGELAVAQPVPEPIREDAIAPATQGGAAWAIALEPQLNVANGSLQQVDMETVQRWLRVYLPRSGDDDKDRRRLQRLHRTLISYPGTDRFTIVVESRKKPYVLEFPNHTTGWCPELNADLLQMVGDENIEVYDRPQ